MYINLTENRLCVSNLSLFDAKATLFCGQAFRWEELSDGSFQGIVAGRKRTLQQAGDTLTIFPVEEAETEYMVHYFALDDDYEAMVTLFSRNPVLRRCMTEAAGIRVLHQDFFEMLMTFIISQNNNIPRIRGIVTRLCENLGEPLSDGGFAFPTAQRLSGLSEPDLAFLRAGWRSGYLLDAARRVASGEVSEEALRRLPLDDARRLLMTIKGVGPKVADCVLLFGLDRCEAFPTDVWIRRAMKELFPKGLPKYCSRYAGVAQQFIFEYARRNPKLFE